jgi:hypothetical protein
MELILGFRVVLQKMHRLLNPLTRYVNLSGLVRETRLQFMLFPEELAAIDDWRSRKRMPSRTAAIRMLIQSGLAQEGLKMAPAGGRSGDFGIIPEGQEN